MSNSIYGNPNEKNPTQEDFGRTVSIFDSITQPITFNFSDLRIRIRSIQIYNNSSAYVGVFLNATPNGNPDFILPPFTLTTLNIIPTQYVSIAWQSNIDYVSGVTTIICSDKKTSASQSSINSQGFLWL